MEQEAIEKMIAAWKRAGDDLQIKIQTPFILKIGDNTEIKFHLLIEKFGSRLGTLILSANNMTEFDTPEKYGYYCSALNPDNYSEYERDHFIDTLSDWGYFGEEVKKPNWYTGEIWQ